MNISLKLLNLTGILICIFQAPTIPRTKPNLRLHMWISSLQPNKTKRSIREAPELVMLIGLSYRLSYLLSSKLFAKHHRSSHFSSTHKLNHNAQTTRLAPDIPGISNPNYIYLHIYITISPSNLHHNTHPPRQTPPTPSEDQRCRPNNILPKRHRTRWPEDCTRHCILLTPINISQSPPLTSV
jgi:hypothetical protein